MSVEFLAEILGDKPRVFRKMAIAAAALYVLAELFATWLAVEHWHAATAGMKAVMISEHVLLVLGLAVFMVTLSKVAIRDEQLKYAMREFSNKLTNLEVCKTWETTDASYEAMTRGVRSAKKAVRTMHLRWNPPRNSSKAGDALQQAIAEWSAKPDGQIYRMINIAGDDADVKKRLDYHTPHKNRTNYDYCGLDWSLRKAPFLNLLIVDESVAFVCAYGAPEENAIDPRLRAIEVRSKRSVQALTEYFDLLYSCGMPKDDINKKYLT